MRRFTFLVGAGVGFVIGSRMGRAPYEFLETCARQVRHSRAVESLPGRAARVVTRIRSNRAVVQLDLMPKGGASVSSYADPQDLEFGAAAARKEAALDEQVARGASVDDLVRAEESLLRHGQLAMPGKADQAHLADGGPRRDGGI
jgi:hypothetical protein